MTKDNDAGVIAQAYVNVAKECNNGDMQRLTKIDERFEFDHPSFEKISRRILVTSVVS